MVGGETRRGGKRKFDVKPYFFSVLGFTPQNVIATSRLHRASWQSCELRCLALCLGDLVGVHRNVHAVPHLIIQCGGNASESAKRWPRPVPVPVLQCQCLCLCSCDDLSSPKN